LSPFARAIAAAREFAGGIAGDCEAAAQSLVENLSNARPGKWSYRTNGMPGFHEFVQLPDGTILDPTAGQFLAKGQVTAAELAGVPGLNDAISSGVFTQSLHQALFNLVAN
jgi:hypothetical protein